MSKREDKYTHGEVIAALCAWEHIDIRSAPTEDLADAFKEKAHILWQQYRRAEGSFEMRDQMIQLGCFIEKLWDRLIEEFDTDGVFEAFGSFDFEFVPIVCEHPVMFKNNFWDIPKDTDEAFEDLSAQVVAALTRMKMRGE